MGAPDGCPRSREFSSNHSRTLPSRRGTGPSDSCRCALARRFTSQVDRRNHRSEMRLLPQPHYRYEIKDEGSPVVDGAVFAFVWTVGTDPEMLVVIEARRTDQRIRWYY